MLSNGRDWTRMFKSKLNFFTIQSLFSRMEMCTQPIKTCWKTLARTKRHSQLLSTTLLRTTIGRMHMTWTTLWPTMLISNTSPSGAKNSSMKRKQRLRRTVFTSDLWNRAASLCISLPTSSRFSSCCWWQPWDSPCSPLFMFSFCFQEWKTVLKYSSNVTFNKEKILKISKMKSTISKINLSREVSAKKF